MITINPIFMTLAQNYLATKKRTPYYEIRSISDECPADGWRNLQPFSKDEMTQLTTLRKKYGKEDFFNHFDEIFDEDSLHDMVYGSEIIGVDIDNEHYMYNFTCHQITSKGVYTDSIKINLTDETYVKLLALHLKDKDLTINKLKYADKSLYEIVTRGVDSCFFFDYVYIACDPYTITMDEIKNDAQKICEQNPDKFQDQHEMISYFI